MCHFLTIKAEASLESVRELVGGDIRVTESNNPNLVRLYERGVRQFVLAEDGCSCRMYSLPSESKSDAAEAAERARRMRARYRRKGWSNEKIERAVRESMSSRTASARFSGLRDDVKEIVGKISLSCGLVGVVIHHYDGAINDEETRIRAERHMSIHEFDEAHQSLPEDELWWIHSEN